MVGRKTTLDLSTAHRSRFLVDYMFISLVGLSSEEKQTNREPVAKWRRAHFRQWCGDSCARSQARTKDARRLARPQIKLSNSTILAIRAKLRSSLACGTCGFVIRFVRTCMSRLYIKDSKLESRNLRCKEKRS